MNLVKAGNRIYNLDFLRCAEFSPAGVTIYLGIHAPEILRGSEADAMREHLLALSTDLPPATPDDRDAQEN